MSKRRDLRGRPARRALGPARAGMTLAFVALVAVAGCGGTSGNSPPPPPPCDQVCMDTTALRAFRETIKLVFNLTLQGKPVGAQDATTPCPLGGSAHIFGDASSNALQGTTEVKLTYELDHCGYARKDADPKQTYSITLTGTVSEQGILAVQPNATTAIELSSDSVTFSGTVYDAPLDYEESACVVQLGQSGGAVSGKMCGRDVGVSL